MKIHRSVFGKALLSLAKVVRRLARKTRKRAKKALNSIFRVLRPLVILPARRVLRRRIPVALITGTKGKTTTTRMLAHILSQAGHTVGYTSTDGIIIDGKSISERDSSGYAPAARVLKRSSITAAVLETARGDLLRNGLYIDRCDVAALLNVGRDHIGVDGIETVQQMANLKRKVVDAANRTVVLNADDRMCRKMIGEFSPERTTIFSFKPHSSIVRQHLKKGGVVFCLEERGEPRIVRLQADLRRTIAPIANLPSAWGGVVRHNIANAMAAAALADGLGVASETIGAALASFENSVEQSPGRFNVISQHPICVIVDRAINPPAAKALVKSLEQIDVPNRRLCMLTSAGNRPPAHFRELGRVLAGAFDHFVCYELEQYRRGRTPGEIAELLRRALHKSGVEGHAVDVASDYPSALQALLRLAEVGDLLVVLGAFKRSEIVKLQTLLSSMHQPANDQEGTHEDLTTHASRSRTRR